MAAVFSLAIPADAHHASTMSGSITISGTASAPSPGACDVSGAAGRCPDGHCLCIVVPNAAATGGLHGAMSISAAIDLGEENAAAGCTPVYAALSGTLSGKHGNPASVFGDAFLVQCEGGKVAAGGWGMSTADGTVTGGGTLSGGFDGANGRVSLVFTGTLTQH